MNGITYSLHVEKKSSDGGDVRRRSLQGGHISRRRSKDFAAERCATWRWVVPVCKHKASEVDDEDDESEVFEEHGDGWRLVGLG
jgi:hypothetical protein